MAHVVLAAAAFLVAAPALAVDVTTCGQEVPEGETGVLTADLDCSSLPDGNAVILGKGATLDLAGHTLTGSPYVMFRSAAVHCAPGGFKCRENS